MKVRDLEGNLSNFKLNGSIINAADNRARSKLHVQAREILYKLFPTMPILEEVLIHTRPRRNQYLDFYINKLKLAIEVHGQQHYKFNSLFHASGQDFLKQKKMDQDKKDWCELNNITYIELPFNEVDKWKKMITQR
tara:strand:- start:695 stop:1102 length:408 start_codon:yes stop_codon:yes gene_type:complete